MANPLKWHGGKTYLAKEIIRRFPKHTRRVYGYAGGLAEMFACNPCEGVAEFANDINGELMNFFAILRSPRFGEELIRQLSLTPFDEREFDQSVFLFSELSQEMRFQQRKFMNAAELAYHFFIRYRMSRQGLGEDFATPTSRTRRGMNENVSSWLSAVDGLPEAAERLLRVELRHKHTPKLIRELDSPETLFYLDPPYLQETRKAKKAYGKNEMTEDDHVELLETLEGVQGKFILSGYPSKLYNGFARRNRWKCDKIEIDNKASSAKKKEIKTECLWFNFSRREFGKGLPE